MAKQYVRKGFEDKIEANLAKICASKNDTFAIVRLEYVRDFACELCEHQHLAKCYWVKNLKTNLIIKVGSECVYHFGIEQSDIDKADALMKLVEKSIEEGRQFKVVEFGTALFNALPEELKALRYFHQKELMSIFGENYDQLPQSTKKMYSLSRDDLIEALGNEHYKNLPRDEKFNLVNDLYRVSYAERLLLEVAHGEHFLTKEEIAEILDLGKQDGMDKANTEALRRKNEKALEQLKSDMYRESDVARVAVAPLDPAIIAGWYTRAAEIGAAEMVDQFVSRFKAQQEAEKARLTEYDWITKYTGSNSFLLDLQRSYNRWHGLTSVQIARGKEVLERELNPPPAADLAELKNMLDALVIKCPNNTFYRSVRNQFLNSGSLSPNQINCVRRSYKQENK